MSETIVPTVLSVRDKLSNALPAVTPNMTRIKQKPNHIFWRTDNWEDSESIADIPQFRSEPVTPSPLLFNVRSLGPSTTAMSDFNGFGVFTDFSSGFFRRYKKPMEDIRLRYRQHRVHREVFAVMTNW